MRILVVSDTHGGYRQLLYAVNQQPQADLLIHLGDGADEFFLLKQTCCFPMQMVKGNCDSERYHLPMDLEMDVCKKRILACHGHQYRVHNGYLSLKPKALKRHADIVLYGHTHEKFTVYDQGIYFLNPGSLARPRDGCAGYGIIDIDEHNVVVNLVEVKHFEI